jgi:hypothetical protein
MLAPVLRDLRICHVTLTATAIVVLLEGCKVHGGVYPADDDQA